MQENYLILNDTITLSTNISSSKANTITYEIMHMEKIVATISTVGRVILHNEKFLPYDLYFETLEDIDTLLNNLNSFYSWCASRVLSLDRKYAKEILNSIGVAQAVTDKERASISLSYHCVSLTDVYWVRKQGEAVTFENINLYDKSLNEAIVEISLKGHQMTVTNRELAHDLATRGCFPKAWIRQGNTFKLLKDGGDDAVKKELLASKICQCFDIPQVKYSAGNYDGQMVSQSDIITSKEYSMVSKMAFEIYASNHDLDMFAEFERIDLRTFYGMNILDYLTGNTDRHPENWGLLVDNRTNEYISLYPLMDFNKCFLAYDNIEGANCLTVLPKKMTQREAAIEAVKKIGLPQIKEMDMSAFEDMKEEAEMFQLRLNELRQIVM